MTNEQKQPAVVGPLDGGVGRLVPEREYFRGLRILEQTIYKPGDPAPTGYLAWHEWAEKKARTHRQTRCPGCGLYKIWKPGAILGDEQ